jgi:DNA polymerase III alpha subunit (gram-positive type)
MKFLIFDCSANGNPKSWSASHRDTFNWPRLVHLSWLLIDEKGKILEQSDDLIKIEGFDISPDIEERHRLTKEQLLSEGKPLIESLKRFNQAILSADYVFAHNLNFNMGILISEYIRSNLSTSLDTADTFCLMQESTYYCQIPGRRGNYKWPSLSELHKKIFKRPYKDQNNALADVNAVTRCFIVLYKTGALEDIF